MGICNMWNSAMRKVICIMDDVEGSGLWFRVNPNTTVNNDSAASILHITFRIPHSKESNKKPCKIIGGMSKGECYYPSMRMENRKDGLICYFIHLMFSVICTLVTL